MPQNDYPSLARWFEGRLASILSTTPPDVLWGDPAYSLVAKVEYLFDFPGDDGPSGAPLQAHIEQLGAAAEIRAAFLNLRGSPVAADGPVPAWRVLKNYGRNQPYSKTFSRRRVLSGVDLSDHVFRCADCWPYAGLFMQMRAAGITGTMPLEPVWLARVREVSQIVLLTRPAKFLHSLLLELAERVELPRGIGAASRSFAEDGRQQAIIDWCARAAPLYTYLPKSNDFGEASQRALRYVVRALDRNARAAALAQSSKLPTSTRRRWTSAGLRYGSLEEQQDAAEVMAKSQRHQLDGFFSQKQVASALRRSRSVVQRYTALLEPSPKQDVDGTWRYSPEDVKRLKGLLPRRHHRT